MVTAAIISSYYIVIIGWVFKYFTLSFSGLPGDIDSSKAIFNELLTHGLGEQTLYFVIAFAACFFHPIKRRKKWYREAKCLDDAKPIYHGFDHACLLYDDGWLCKIG